MAIDKIQSESINLADTFAFTGTVTGAGASNKPAFFAKKNSNTDISNNTWTLVDFETEVIDTNSAYDTSNYRFTVPSGEAGKYFIFNTVQAASNSTRVIIEILSRIRKNGTQETYAHASFYNTATAHQLDLSNNCILDLSAGDYLDVQGYINVSSGTPKFAGNSSNLRSFFGGYKLF
jgi:hypothetical protein